MKTIIKIILVIGVLIAVIGAANTKSLLNKSIDGIAVGVDKIKNNNSFKGFSDISKSFK